MRRFVALLRREMRDARWHFAASLVVAAAAPWCVHEWMTAGADDELVAKIGGRGVVPILFALFVASAASDLVARDVATRRIDGLAVLPVPIAKVWTAKAALLAASSLAMLAWIVAAEWAALAFGVSDRAAAWLPSMLVAAGPSIAGGVALGAASLFLSTLLERGISAALGAVVLLVGVVLCVEWAEVPVADGTMTTFAGWAAPLGLAAAFVVASRSSFVRGPIHGPSKPRLALCGFAALAAVAAPGGVATAMSLEHAADLAPGAGDPSRREAYVSPDGKWVAIEDGVAGGASATWLASIDGASCRRIAPGTTWFADGVAWLPGSMLAVRSSSFSLMVGPRCVRRLEVEPTGLGVAESHWLPAERAPERPYGWAWVQTEEVLSPTRSVFVVHSSGSYPSRRYTARWVQASPERGVVFVVSEDRALSRVTFVSGGKDDTVDLARDLDAVLQVSADGKRILLDGHRDVRVLDATTGAVLFTAPDGRAKWTEDGSRVFLWDEDASESVTRFAVHDLGSGTSADFGAPKVSSRLPRVSVLRDGRLVVCDGDVTLRAKDGKVLRRLYPPVAAEKGN